MRGNWIAALLRNPVKVSVGVLLVILFGCITLLRMPVQLTPEVQYPIVGVFTVWPGASPLEIEREIIQPQEEQLKQVEGVKKLSSECYHSAGRITLEFDYATDINEALLRVSIRLQQVRGYPEDALEPVIYTSGLSDQPIAWFILSPRVPERKEIEEAKARFPQLSKELDAIARAHNPEVGLLWLERLVKKEPGLAYLLPPQVDIVSMRKFVEDVIEARLERVPGVSNANVFGGRARQFEVRVDPDKLAAWGITISDVRNAIRAQNIDATAGDFWEGKRQYVVRAVGQYRRPEDVANTVITYRNGTPVYVRDVATVGLGYGKPGGLSRRFGRENISINIERATGANVLDVMTELRRVVDDLNRFVLRPRGLQMTQVYDETEYITSAIGLVTNNLYLATALATAVLLIFLRSARSTLVLALAIPVSVFGAFLILGLLGRTLNVVSLAGLAFAIGMLVDNAVVVLENIYRHRQLGRSVTDSVIRGTQEVWGAVLSSTLTTLAVFLPVLFVREEAGQLFRDIALAISGAVGLSLIVAVTVIPVAASRLLGGRTSHAHGSKGDGTAEGNGRLLARQWRRATEFAIAAGRRAISPLERIGAAFIAVVLSINRWLLRGFFRRVVVLLTVVTASIGVGYVLFPPLEYLPQGNRNLIIGVLIPPPGYNLRKLLEMGARVEEKLRPYWDVDLADPTLKESKYPPISEFFFVAQGRIAYFGVKSADPSRVRELLPLVQETVNMFPGTTGIASQTSLFQRGLGGRGVSLEISGPDLTKLQAVGRLVMERLPQVIPGSQALPNPGLETLNPEVHVVPKREQAAELGISMAELAYTLDALIDGAYADDYFIGGERVDLKILGPHVYEASPQGIEDLPIATPTRHVVPLRAVATVRRSSGPEQINRRERQRAITINITPPTEMPLEVAMQRVEEGIIRPLEQEGLVGTDVQMYLSGTADQLRQTWAAMRFNVFLALVITYLLMAGLFESWLYPFVVILTVPLGAVGGIAALRIVNLFTPQPLDVLTMLGFVILVGTVVNNAILIVHQALNHVHFDGMPWRESILESVRNRIRPIFMTTLTTVFGLCPLVLFPGPGSELYRGLGAVVLGGLLVSAVFTLLVTPIMLSIAWQVRDVFVSSLRGTEPPSSRPEEAPAEQPLGV